MIITSVMQNLVQLLLIAKREKLEHARTAKDPREEMKMSDCERTERAVENDSLPFALGDGLLLNK